MPTNKTFYVIIFLGIVLFYFVDRDFRIAIIVGISLLIFLELIPILKRRRILKKSVVKVSKIKGVHPNLPLLQYGCPLAKNSKSLRSKGLIELAFPLLDSSGELKYIFSRHPVYQIYFVNLNRRKISRELELAKEILPLIQPHLAISEEITELLNERNKLDEISNLVATSTVYSRQYEIYKRARVQLNNIINKADELKNIYGTLIREGLIGLKISQYSTDNFLDNRIVFDAQYKELQAEYQLLKDTADAYAELSLSST